VNENIVIQIIPERTKPGDPPPEIRLRRWLKDGLRRYGLRASWGPSAREAIGGKIGDAMQHVRFVTSDGDEVMAAQQMMRPQPGDRCLWMGRWWTVTDHPAAVQRLDRGDGVRWCCTLVVEGADGDGLPVRPMVPKSHPVFVGGVRRGRPKLVEPSV